MWVAVAKEGSACRALGVMLGEKALMKVEVNSCMGEERCTDDEGLGDVERDRFILTGLRLLSSGAALCPGRNMVATLCTVPLVGGV